MKISAMSRDRSDISQRRKWKENINIANDNAPLFSVTPLRDPRTPSPVAEQRRTPGASCQALRHAVNSLYRLDDFHTETLGSGFFSEVYKVTDKSSGQVMVLKMNMAITNRPNMLREYINGGSLEGLIQDENCDLPWSTRTKLATDIAKGMRYLHQRHIMHRDLTSKNVLIKIEEDNNLVAVVGDFGLACKIPDPIDEDSNHLATVGSPFWIAPECIRGLRYNELADVFSYGIILCEMIARIEADPDILPRTHNFGLDYVAFSKMVEDCPLNFLHFAFNCCQIDPKKRPTFMEVVGQLDELRSRSQMAIVLADISSMGAGDVMNKTILEKILDGRGHRRNRSDETLRFRTPDLDGMDTANPPDNVIPVTPLIVGEVMSKDDLFYLPHKDNPFTERFPHWNSTKLVGNVQDNWCDWFELPSPASALTPPCTPRSSEDRDARTSRNCHSLPGSPTLARREIDRFQYEAATYTSATAAAMRTFSVMTSLRKLELEEEEFCDAHSEGSSSNDSGMDMIMRDLRSSSSSSSKYFRSPSHRFGRHLSIDPCQLSSPGSSSSPGVHSRTELLTRFMEAKLHEPRHTMTTHDMTRSYSSSESCMSLDESSSLLSPTSSYSSYTDAAEELWHTRAQWELYEHRLRSRQKFQELVASWEAKHAALEADGTTPKGGGSSPTEALQQQKHQQQQQVREMGRKLYLHERLEHSDPHLEKKFQEIRRKWETKQLSLEGSKQLLKQQQAKRNNSTE